MAVVKTDTFTTGSNLAITTYDPDVEYIAGSSGLDAKSAGYAEVGVAGETCIRQKTSIPGMPTGIQKQTLWIRNSQTNAWSRNLILCGAPGNFNCYLHQINGGDANEIQIYRVDNASYTLLASWDQGIPNDGNLYKTELWCSNLTGSTDLHLIVDNGTERTYSDSSGSRKTSGTPGYGGYSFGARVDDLEIDDLASAGDAILAAAANSTAATGVVIGFGILPASAANPATGAANLAAVAEMFACAAAPVSSTCALVAAAPNFIAAASSWPHGGAANLAAFAALVAAANNDASAHANLLAVGALNAAAVVPADGTANLVAVAEMFACAAAPVAGTCVLVAAAPDAIAAASSMTVCGFGILIGLANLAASSANTGEASGHLVATATSRAAVSLPIAAGGLLAGLGHLKAGSANPSIAASAAIGRGDLISASSFAITAYALTVALGSMRAASAASMCGSGRLGDGSDVEPVEIQRIIRGESPFVTTIFGESHLITLISGKSRLEQIQ